MLDEQDLIGLLRAYVGGDVLARKVLVDALDEAGDARASSVGEEQIDWNTLAQRLAGEPLRALRPGQVLIGKSAYLRWLIDCARVGSPTRPEVTQAVSDARRKWLKQLFPELEL